MLLPLLLPCLVVAQADAQPEGRLALSEPIACRAIRGYEDYDLREPAEVTRNEKLLIYVRPTGHAIESVDGHHRVHLVQDLRIRRKGKKRILWERKGILDLRLESEERPERLYLGTTVGLKGFALGEYEAELVVRDELAGGATASRTLGFRVVATPPPPPPDEKAAAPRGQGGLGRDGAG